MMKSLILFFLLVTLALAENLLIEKLRDKRQSYNSWPSIGGCGGGYSGGGGGCCSGGCNIPPPQPPICNDQCQGFQCNRQCSPPQPLIQQIQPIQTHCGACFQRCQQTCSGYLPCSSSCSSQCGNSCYGYGGGSLYGGYTGGVGLQQINQLGGYPMSSGYSRGYPISSGYQGGYPMSSGLISAGNVRG